MAFRFGDGRDWFFRKRFGMFIHWGLYAVPAFHEQVQWRKKIPRSEYRKLIEQFNPVRYDPDAWLDLAAAAGMEYLCLTTKHHDGFCLWNTAQTRYNVMHSPYGRDIVKMLAGACGRRDVPLCAYYSVVDWHEPSYPNQNRSHELAGPEEGDRPDLGKYVAFLREQVRELCTQYGKLHGFWWDMNVTGRKDPSINQGIRSLQPDAVINNRGFDDGDFGTPERGSGDATDARAPFERPTEVCQSVGCESWGYKQDEDYFSDRHLIGSIDKALCKGGNYLLNVGPMADGTIPPPAERILRRIGAWYHSVKEAFADTEPASDLTDNPDVMLTRRGRTLYVHLTDPTRARVLLKPINRLPRTATLLNTNRPVECVVDWVPMQYPDTSQYLRLRNLPVNEHAGEVLVVKLEFDDATCLDRPGNS